MAQEYGLWPLVILNTVLLVVFAASFFHPRSRRDWRVLGGFGAFMLALFTEMYGAPLTVYLLSGWLGSRVPALRPTHAGGHLWNDLIGWPWDPHVSPFHIASYAAIGGGFWLVAAAWKVLYTAAADGVLATSGPYARVRHPQYVGFVLVMVGFLLQWPTVATLAMFPVLLVVYRRLAMGEEREMAATFGSAWSAWSAITPRFVPRRRSSALRPRIGGPAQSAEPRVPAAPVGASANSHRSR